MVADNRGEHIVIYNRKEHMIKLLKQNIATPYIRYGGNPSSPAEIGYCVVNNNNEVKSIHIIRKDIQTFIFILDVYKDLLDEICYSMTRDGYLRFWSSNNKYHLFWSVGKESNDGVLMPHINSD